MDYITTRALAIYALAEGGGEPDAIDLPLYRLYAILSFAKGTETTAEDVHNCWSAWVAAHNPEHRSLKPFAELSPAVQRMDDPYVEAIRKAATS